MINKKIKYILFISTLFIFSQFILLPAFATETKTIKPNTEYEIPGVDLTPVTVEAGKTMSVPWIKEYIIGIYKYLISIVGILVGVVIMIAGFMWASAGGNQTTIGNARAWIVSALSALIIAISGVAILNLLNPKLTEFGDIQVEQPSTPLLSDWASDCQWLNLTNGARCSSPIVGGGWRKPSENEECKEEMPDATDEYNTWICCCVETAETKTAKQILDSGGKITLSSNADCGEYHAKKTMEEIAAKGVATACDPYCSCNRQIKVSEAMLQGILDASQSTRMVITSITTGRHSKNSRHYTGTALDAVPYDKSFNGWKTLMSAFNSAGGTAKFEYIDADGKRQLISDLNDPTLLTDRRIKGQHLHITY